MDSVNNSISIKELNNIFREIRIDFVLSDLQTLLDVLNNNRNNNYISFDKLINLIKGNLDERRKLEYNIVLPKTKRQISKHLHQNIELFYLYE